MQLFCTKKYTYASQIAGEKEKEREREREREWSTE
jgi:hypothetical protein